MQQIHVRPSEYHNLKFDISKLPDLAAAGPVSASILSKSRDVLTFLLDQKQKETNDMQWGSLIDCMWTTPELFDSDYVVLPPDAPQKPTEAMLKAAKPSANSQERISWWEAFNSQIRGRITLTDDVYQQALTAVRMLKEHSLAVGIHSVSDKQVALLGDYPDIPGVKAKCLFDLLPREGPFVNAIVDLKTTNDTSTHATVGTMWKFDYVVKLAFYGILAEAAGFGARPRGILIWQKSSFPYDVHVREISETDMAIGRTVARHRLLRLSQLNPGRVADYYDNTLQTISLAEWQQKSYLEL